MARSPRSPNGKSSKQVDALKHDEATRRNIPTAEMESFFRRDEDAAPRPPKHYPRTRPLAEGETRTPEEPSQPELIWNGAKITITDEQMKELAETGTLTLSDAQLVWRGKDRQDWTDLVVNVPPLYIQEKVHPKAIIEDLKRRTAAKREAEAAIPDLFADFNGIAPEQRAEFYQHDQHWSNRMILGDSLQVMASLSERESLKGKVQCIYFDPPYGIKFNSNWQVKTDDRNVADGKREGRTFEPEQVKAFRDTWKDKIHSYLTYLRDRLTAMRDLLTESGSIFVQIGDENVHRVRAVMDEIFGAENFIALIGVAKTSGLQSGSSLPSVLDYVLQYSRNANAVKFRPLYIDKREETEGASEYFYKELSDGTRQSMTADERTGQTPLPTDARAYSLSDLTKPGPGSRFELAFRGRLYASGGRWWGMPSESLLRAGKAERLHQRKNDVRFIRYLDDFPLRPLNNYWRDGGFSSRGEDKVYIVQTAARIVERCILMATDPSDLVLDPTCGSGTTAYVAEQWGRRWITIDTSRVALALARTRLMAARYPWYLLADSREGRAKEAALTQRVPPETPVHSDLRQGFVCERVPHITLKSIANNPLIDDIWEKWQAVLEPLRASLNAALGKSYEEWQIPRDLPVGAPASAMEPHAKWWEARIARQKEIDASIAARAEVEYLYDKPYVDNARVRGREPVAPSCVASKRG
jgi:adenine-specific DNA-methyltransferase